MSRRLLAVVTLVVASLVPAPPAQAAPSLVRISGAGSTWSFNAIDNWRQNIKKSGIVVDYEPKGSTDGRTQFYNGTVDFGVSEIPYGLPDAFAETDLPPTHRPFGYMPIVAGGTAFMYHLRIGGKIVTNLRLSGENIVRIFTKDITMWNDARIKADNPGLNLPPRRIIPVVRSDGSGTTAQFTLWMSKRYPALWNAFCQARGKTPPCGLTSFFPVSGYEAKAQSANVAGYVAQANSDGAITYVEYSYAINARFPVVKVLNDAGYYIEPTAKAVAVALTAADIVNSPADPKTHLTQKLDGVYANSDKRAYPLSSYSYMILPRQVQGSFTENKGYTLAKFGYYFLCEGQQAAEDLGYSPLPINLVRAGLTQIEALPGVVKVDRPIESCNNPTFSSSGTNTLATTAPQPKECDRQGTKQCPDGTGGARTPTAVTAAAGGGTATTGTGGTGTTTTGSTTGVDGASVIDPDTGLPVAAGNDTAGGGAGLSGLAGVPVQLAADDGWQLRHTMMLLAAILLGALVLGPPLLSRALGRRRERGTP